MKLLKDLKKENWETKSLEEISRSISIGNSIVTKEHKNKVFPAIKSGDLTNLKTWFLTDCKTFIDNVDLNKFTLCEFGDVLMIQESMSKYLIGKTYLYLGKSNCLIAPEIYLIKHNLNPFYLISSFQSWKLKRKVYWAYQKNASPSRCIKIFLNDLKKLQLLIPSKRIQDLIGKFLYELSFLTEKLEKTLNEIREKKLEQYIHYSEELLINKNNAKLIFLSDVASDIYYGKEIFKSQLNTGSYPAIKPGDVNSRISRTFYKCVSFVDENLLKEKKYFEYGDILFASIADKKTAGKSVVYLGKEKCFLGKGVICLKHQENPKFLAYSLSTKLFKKQVNSLISKSTIVNFYPTHIKQIKISLPSLEEQQKIVDKLDILYNSIERLKVIIPELIELNKLRLQYYINTLTNPKFLNNETT